MGYLHNPLTSVILSSQPMQTDPAHLYRKLPQVGELLLRSDFLPLQQTYSRELIAEAVRSTLQDLRGEIKAGRHNENSLLTLTSRLN